MSEERRTTMDEVKFEAGQRWLTETLRIVLTSRVFGGAPAWIDNNGRLWVEEYLTRCGRLEAPAPKPHQRWESTSRMAVQIVDADGEFVAEEWDWGEPMCRGGLLDVAEWLAEFDFKCVADSYIACVDAEQTGAVCLEHSGGTIKPEHIARSANDGGSFSVSLPPLPTGQYTVSIDFTNRSVSVRGQDGEPLPELTPDLVDASDEEFPPTEAPMATSTKFAPVPLAMSRRLVDEAVKTLRGEPFARAIQAVLISLCGDRLEFGPRQVDIEAAINACQAWEHARSKVAPGKRTLSKAERRELTETAKIAAWGTGISMQDASDIGEIVGETYERARATC